MSVQYDTDESELLKAIAADNTESFEVLYNLYWKPLYLTATKVLRSADEAEDVVQDVFMSFWNRRKEIIITTSIKAYLMTSVKYKAIHYIEKNITRRDYLSLLTDTLKDSSPADAETRLYVKELQLAVDKALKTMPAKMLNVYNLSRNEHLSHKEIAEKVGISSETVKKHIQHALQHIREVISSTNTPLTTLLIAVFFGK